MKKATNIKKLQKHFDNLVYELNLAIDDGYHVYDEADDKLRELKSQKESAMVIFDQKIIVDLTAQECDDLYEARRELYHQFERFIETYERLTGK